METGEVKARVGKRVHNKETDLKLTDLDHTFEESAFWERENRERVGRRL